MKWKSGPKDRPKRDLTAVKLIGEIVGRFDVVAVQEVAGDLAALRMILKMLGPKWGFLMTDENRGARGGGERLAYLFDSSRVRPSGLACELVVPADQPIAKAAFGRQFARNPYGVSFWSRGQTFVLVTAHVVYRASAKEERLAELSAIAKWMAEWAKRTETYGQNLFVLGDFNIDRAGDRCFEAFTSTGLHVPEALNDVPRTIVDEPNKRMSFYDQIAWFRDKKGKDLITLKPGRAGTFRFDDHVLTGLSRNDLSFRMSDHLPLWVELGM